MVTPDSILALAEELAGRGDEVGYRSAASRAYYAAHHALLPIVVQCPEVKTSPFPGRCGHQEMVRRLEAWKHPDPALAELKYPAKSLSRVVRAMIATREQADYHLHDMFDHRDCEMQILRSKQAARFVASCLERIAA